ncbi:MULTISPECIES: hypothetical protein [unclassified Rhizobium]|uniref:hypothetical protein n=1 Tax=unclassified Rhizobium TaxID=2613769 RepID=UPI0012E22C4E|nr:MULTISPECIES: hypothetical protein [unclassified Rhizobium]
MGLENEVAQMGNEYVDAVEAAIERTVNARRNLMAAVGTRDGGDKAIDNIIRYQNALEALYRARDNEKSLLSPDV